MTYNMYTVPQSESIHFATWAAVQNSLGAKETLQLGRNIVLYRSKICEISLRFYDTDILTWDTVDYVTINTGGYTTKATMEVLNRYLPPNFYVVTERGQWYLKAYEHVYPLFDGMHVHMLTGELDYRQKQAVTDATKNILANTAMRKRIHDYVQRLDLRTIDMDTSVDCWHCLMHTIDTGKSMGDAFHNHQHLQDHMTEHYYPFSMIVNAFQEYQPDNWQSALSYWTNGLCHPNFLASANEQVRHVLAKYLKKRLFKGVVAVR